MEGERAGGRASGLRCQADTAYVALRSRHSTTPHDRVPAACCRSRWAPGSGTGSPAMHAPPQLLSAAPLTLRHVPGVGGQQRRRRLPALQRRRRQPPRSRRHAAAASAAVQRHCRLAHQGCAVHAATVGSAAAADASRQVVLVVVVQLLVVVVQLLQHPAPKGRLLADRPHAVGQVELLVQFVQLIIVKAGDVRRGEHRRRSGEHGRPAAAVRAAAAAGRGAEHAAHAAAAAGAQGSQGRQQATAAAERLLHVQHGRGGAQARIHVRQLAAVGLAQARRVAAGVAQRPDALCVDRHPHVAQSLRAGGRGRAAAVGHCWVRWGATRPGSCLAAGAGQGRGGGGGCGRPQQARRVCSLPLPGCRPGANHAGGRPPRCVLTGLLGAEGGARRPPSPAAQRPCPGPGRP